MGAGVSAGVFNPATGGWELPGAGGVPAAPAPGATPQPAAPQAAAPPKGQAAPPFATMTPGNSPVYGMQSPTMFGTGTYTAPLLPINDQAITGAPSQGSGTNYGLNSVWDNLNTELANAPNQGAGMVAATTGGPASYGAATGQAAQAQAAQGGYATAAPTALGVGGNTIAQQAALAQTLNTQANGGGVSPADLQLQQGAQQNLAAQLAALGSQRGSTNAALAQRAAADQAATAGATLNQNEGIQRAQETEAAQQAEGAVLGAQGSQAAGINSTAAGLQQQTELANAANAQQSTLANTENAQQAALANQAAINAMTSGNLSAVNAANLGNAQLSQQQELANLGFKNQDTLANQNTQLANAQLQDNQTNAVLGAQTSIGEANKASSLADQQLQLQQLIAANQVNEQGYQASANANANLTGAAIGAAGSLLGAGINAAGAGAAGAGSGAGVASGPVGAGEASGITGLSSDGTWSGTLPWQPGAQPMLASSDENLKEGIEGGNPMMRSFLENYRSATQPKIDVAEGSGFRNPTYGKTPGTASAGGGGIGAGIGSILGGLAGSFLLPGVGTALGAAAGGQVGGAIGGAVDPSKVSGGGTVQTSPGSGVTVDIGQAQDIHPMPQWQVDVGHPEFDTPGMALSDERQKTKLNDSDALASLRAAFPQVYSAAASDTPQMPPMLLQKALQDKQITSEQYNRAMDAYNARSMPMSGPVSADSMQYALDSADPNASPSRGYMPMFPGEGWDKLPGPSDYQYGVGGATGYAVPRADSPQAFQRSALSDENEKDAVTSGNRGMQAFLSQANAQQNAQNKSGSQNNAFMQTGAPPSSQVDTQLPNSSFSGNAYQGGPPGVGYGMPPFAQGGTVSGGGITNYGGYQGASTNPGGGVGPPPNAPLSLQYETPVSQAAQQSLASAQVRPPPVSGVTYTPQAQQQYISGLSSYLASLGAGGTALSDEDEKVKSRDPGDVQSMLDSLQAYKYRYKDPDAPGAMPGDRLGVMAQDLEKSPLGKQFVDEDGAGHKFVNYGQMAGTQLAASAYLNDRLDKHEAMLKHLMGSRS